VGQRGAVTVGASDTLPLMPRGYELRFEIHVADEALGIVGGR
jgi:hypothetical protein